MLRNFLDTVADQVARRAVSCLTDHDAHLSGRAKGSWWARTPARQRTAPEAWLDALGDDPLVQGDPYQSRTFAAQYGTWKAAAKQAESGPFRVCFRLEPPDLGDAQPLLIGEPHEEWRLSYLLQAADDPSLLVSAGEVWRERGATAELLNRRLAQPQERLLAGLGRAARFFPPIDVSLGSAAPERCALDTGQAYSFLQDASTTLRAAGFGVLLPRISSGPSVRARVKGQSSAAGPASFGWNQLISFDWELALGDESVSRKEFEALAKLKTPLVQIRGRWVEMQPDQVRQTLDLLRRMEKQELGVADVVRLALDSGQDAAGGSINLVAEGWVDDLLKQLCGRDNEATAPTRLELTEPEGFFGELRPYQRVGMSWMATLQEAGLGGCLADDMGLGKTVQVIALLQHRAQQRIGAVAGENGASVAHPEPFGELRRGPVEGASSHSSHSKPRPALLICPTSVVSNWRRELERFAPSLRVLVHHGVERDRENLAATASGFDVVISTYALLARDVAQLGEIEWGDLILDEAQNIKNASTQAAQAARALRSQWRVALSGTPIENRLDDLWSILHFLNPGYLGSAQEFRRRYAGPIERGHDAAASTKLQRLVRPFILRRLKTDASIISDLPEKQEMTVFCSLTREQATLYEAVLRDAMDQIENADGIQRRGLVLATLTKLKQVCDHPALFLHGGETLGGRSGKLDRLVEMLEEVQQAGERSLIFTQYAEMGRLLKRHVEDVLGGAALYLHGGTPMAERERMVTRFQAEGSGPGVFILSLKAGGTGLNLTQANHVFHFDRWWNPAVERQATDRAFRIGQKRNVQVRTFLCGGTFEETLDQLIARKVALSESIVETSESWITELSNHELRDLFALRPEDRQ